MTVNQLADAINEIDNELISTAVIYKRKSIANFMKYGAIAATFIVILAAVIIVNEKNNNSVNDNVLSYNSTLATINTTIKKNEKTTASVNEKVSDFAEKNTVTQSLTTAETNSTTKVFTDDNPDPSVREWEIKEIEYAMTALPNTDAKKINIEKSYNEAMISEQPTDDYHWSAADLPEWEYGVAEEAFVIHLDAEDFYYEVVISADMKKTYAFKKFDK